MKLTREIFEALIKTAEYNAYAEAQQERINTEEDESNDGNSYYEGMGIGEIYLGFITKRELDEIYNIANDCDVSCWTLNDLTVNPTCEYIIWIKVDYNTWTGYENSHPTWGLTRV